MSTVGTRGFAGPRNVVQWRRSRPARATREPDRVPERVAHDARGAAVTRRRSGARGRAPAARAERRRSPRTCRAVPARVCTSGEASTPTLTPRPRAVELRSPHRVLRLRIAQQRDRVLAAEHQRCPRARRRAPAPSRRRLGGERGHGDLGHVRLEARADLRRLVVERIRVARARVDAPLRRAPSPRAARARRRPRHPLRPRAPRRRGASTPGARASVRGRGTPRPPLPRGGRRRSLLRPPHRAPPRTRAGRVSPTARQVNAVACSSPAADEPPAIPERALDRRGDRAGSSGSARTAASAARLVERGMRGGDDRAAAGHRLDDRHPEALEARGIDGDRGAAVETRELVVGDEPEPADPGVVEERLLAPALPRRRPRAGDRRRAGDAPRRASAGSCAARAWRR